MPLRRTQMPPRSHALARHAGLKAVTALRAMSPRRAAELAAAGKPTGSTIVPKPRKPAVPVNLRRIITARAGKWCELTLPGCWGYGTDTAHRKAVKAGGRWGKDKAAHNVPSNCLFACRFCHGTIHAEPAWAGHPDRGYMLTEVQDPATSPVLYRRRRLVLLDDDGSISVYRGAS